MTVIFAIHGEIQSIIVASLCLFYFGSNGNERARGAIISCCACSVHACYGGRWKRGKSVSDSRKHMVRSMSVHQEHVHSASKSIVNYTAWLRTGTSSKTSFWLNCSFQPYFFVHFTSLMKSRNHVNLIDRPMLLRKMVLRHLFTQTVLPWTISENLWSSTVHESRKKLSESHVMVLIIFVTSFTHVHRNRDGQDQHDKWFSVLFQRTLSDSLRSNQQNMIYWLIGSATVFPMPISMWTFLICGQSQ